MKTNRLTKIITSSVIGFGTYITSTAAFAAPTPPPGIPTNLSGVEQNVATAFHSGANILYLIAACVGLLFTVAGLVKLKAHSHDMQGTSGHMKGGVTLLIVGMLLIAIPVIMLVGHNSIFGQSATPLVLPTESGALNNA